MIPMLLIASLTEAIERRRSQFPRDFGYLIAPIPYILPGVGTGLGVIGMLTKKRIFYRISISWKDRFELQILFLFFKRQSKATFLRK